MISITRLATAIIVVIVVIAGAVVTILHPGTLSFAAYVKDVSVAAGLLAVGYGLDANSKP